MLLSVVGIAACLAGLSLSLVYAVSGIRKRPGARDEVKPGMAVSTWTHLESCNCFIGPRTLTMTAFYKFGRSVHALGASSCQERSVRFTSGFSTSLQEGSSEVIQGKAEERRLAALDETQRW